MSSPKFTPYGTAISPPTRAVELTLKALNLDYARQEINPLAGEHKSPEYLKKNPLHTIPTLEDGGKFLADSHAICAYLVRKYGKTDALYPRDHYQRAVVDQRLHYENGVLFMCCIRPAVRPILKGELTKEKFDEVAKSVLAAYDALETFLGDNQYMAGSSLTIADFSIVATVSSLVHIQTFDAAKHQKLAAWLERMQQLPYYGEANGRGVAEVQAMLQEKLAPFK